MGEALKRPKKKRFPERWQDLSGWMSVEGWSGSEDLSVQAWGH